MIIYPDPNAGDKSEGVPPPPQPPITIRTMDSDIKSMQENGGGAPQEEIINAPRAPIQPNMPNPNDEDMRIKIQGYGGPEKGVFSSVSLPSSEKGTDQQTPTPIQTNPSGGGALGKIIALLVTIIVAAAIGVGLYFYVYPFLLTPSTSPTPEPSASASSTPIQAAPSATPSPITSVHNSLIKSSKNEEASSMSEVKAEVVAAGSSLLKEIILKKDGSQTLLSNYFPNIITELSSSDLSSNFDNDFTAFIYYDENGAWPGYALKRKQGISPFAAQNTFRKIETSKSLSNLYLFNVGNKKGEFKNGTYKGVDTHYLVFESKGASLNYAWKDDILIITTTFPALKAIIDGSSATPNNPQASSNQTTDKSPTGVYMRYKGEMEGIKSTDPTTVFEESKVIAIKYSTAANKKKFEEINIKDIPPDMLAGLVEILKAVKVADLEKATSNEVISGDKATLKITLATPVVIAGISMKTATISMLKEGGEWKIDSEAWK